LTGFHAWEGFRLNVPGSKDAPHLGVPGAIEATIDERLAPVYDLNYGVGASAPPPADDQRTAARRALEDSASSTASHTAPRINGLVENRSHLAAAVDWTAAVFTSVL
jgi:hypothetical protein